MTSIRSFSPRLWLIRLVSTSALLAGAPVIDDAGSLESQARPQSPSAECMRLRESLNSVPLPRADDRSWYAIRACGPEGGNALAAAVRRLGGTADTSILAAAVRGIALFRDASVLAALRDLASDASATRAARTTALHGMLLYVHPEVGLSSMLAEVSRGGEECFTTSSYGRPPRIDGAPFPEDYMERIAATARDLAGSGGDGVVQAAARCVLSHLPREIFARTVDPSSIRLTNTCGNRFLIENLGESRVLLEAVIVGTTHRFKFVLPAGKSRSFRTIEAGSVRLDHNGSPLLSKENEGRPCPDPQ